MINRKIARAAVTLVVLGVSTQASVGASFCDVGVNCGARDIQGDNDIVSSRACTAEAGIEFTRGPGICGGHAIRATSAVAYFNAITRIRAAHQNLCARTNAFVPLSYLPAQ